jgi:predicted RNase H-like HicB family nuclease
MAGYHIRLVEDKMPNGERVWYAEHPELLGCHAVGPEPNDAIDGLKEARNAWIKVALKYGDEVPKPKQSPQLEIVYAEDSPGPVRLMAGWDHADIATATAAVLVAEDADASARSRTGFEPERLKIEGDWEDVAEKMLKTKKPEGGWPKP